MSGRLSREAPIGYPVQARSEPAALPQRRFERGDGPDGCWPMLRLTRDARAYLGTDVQRDVVAVAGPVMCALPQFQVHLGRTDAGQLSGKQSEELRVDRQLRVLRHRLRNALPQLNGVRRRGCIT